MQNFSTVLALKEKPMEQKFFSLSIINIFCAHSSIYFLPYYVFIQCGVHWRNVLHLLRFLFSEHLKALFKH